MRRICTAVLMAVVLALLILPATAFAEDTQHNWTVEFKNKDEKILHDDFQEEIEDYFDKWNGLEPGDSLTLEVTLKHSEQTSADWYISNEVVKSLEDPKDENGRSINPNIRSAYTYTLTYIPPKNSNKKNVVLYDSDAIGGENTDDGLRNATTMLDDEEMIYLDTLSKGDTAKVTLKVVFDGETEGNIYFDTSAKLKMKFGVEVPESKTTTNRKVVKTGDDTNLVPFYVAMAISGVALLGLGIASIRARKRSDSQNTHAR